MHFDENNPITELIFADENGILFKYNSAYTIPEIREVRSFNDKTTVVFFTDGTKETAVCSDEDTYSLEQGITVCLAKKACGGKYNQIVHKAAKQYRDRIKAHKEEEEKKKKEHEERMQTQQNRAKKRREKEAAATSSMIAAGILQALQELSDADILKIVAESDQE